MARGYCGNASVPALLGMEYFNSQLHVSQQPFFFIFFKHLGLEHKSREKYGSVYGATTICFKSVPFVLHQGELREDTTILAIGLIELAFFFRGRRGVCLARTRTFEYFGHRWDYERYGGSVVERRCITFGGACSI
jgi:hypothetical protein